MYCFDDVPAVLVVVFRDKVGLLETKHGKSHVIEPNANVHRNSKMVDGQLKTLVNTRGPQRQSLKPFHDPCK